MSDNTEITTVETLLPDPQDPPDVPSPSEADIIALAEKHGAIPELTVNQMMGVFLTHARELKTKEHMYRVLLHVVTFPFENENMPRLKGQHSRVAFMAAAKIIDAKILMLARQMKNLESSTVESIDELIRQLNGKREALLKNQDVVNLSDKDATLFEKTLENPPEPNEALKNLMNTETKTEGETNNG